MASRFKNANRILILGDSGRGKTTLAQKLSKKLNIQSYSTDDFFWETKFSEMRDRKKSIEGIRKAYSEDKWIVEGATRHLINPGLKKANLIIYLAFRDVFSQWWALIKRNRTRKEESLSNLFKLLRHELYKRYGIGNEKKKPNLLELLEPFQKKLVVLTSFEEIEKFLKNGRI